jgi:hypothetical protein
VANFSAVGKQEQRALDALWQSLQPKHAKVSFCDEHAAQALQWEEYLQRVEKGGVLLSAYMAISEYE